MKKTVIAGIILSISLVAISSFAIFNKSTLLNAQANVGNQIVLDNNSSFTFNNDSEKIHIATQKTNNGNDVKFMACGFTSSTGFGRLKEGDSQGSDYFLSNVDRLFGLESFTINFTAVSGSARIYLEYSYDTTGDVNSDYVTSGVAYSFAKVGSHRPNCFKIYAYNGDVDIENISMTLTCEGADGYFPGNLVASKNGDVASVTSHVYLSAGTRPIVIPDYYDGVPITSLANNIFSNDYCISYVSFPRTSGFTTIPTKCLYGCIRLVYAVIPTNVTSIQSSAFYSCSGLKTIFYEGTEQQWNSVNKASDWKPYSFSNIVFLNNIL